jgi:hypothetical protein
VVKGMRRMQSAGRRGKLTKANKNCTWQFNEYYRKFLILQFFCVQNTTLLRSENFNTAIAIRQRRKKKKRFLSLRKLNIKRIFL